MTLGTGSATDSGLLVLLGGLCLVILTVSVYRRAQQRRASARDLTREQRARLRDQQELRKSMEDLLGQLEEAAVRINAHIDDRTARLDAALRAADERIARLGIASPQPPVPDAHERTPPAEPLPARSRRVCELADRGTPSIAIADALKMPVGEVELILNLRNYQSQLAQQRHD